MEVDINALAATYIEALAHYRKSFHSQAIGGEPRRVYSEILNLRALSAYEIRLLKDLDVVQARIRRAVELQIWLLEEFDKGNQRVDGSLVTMTSFHLGLDAFALGCQNTGRQFFSKIGGRKKEEQRNDSKFISSIGYAIKDLVMDGQCPPNRVDDLRQNFSKPSLSGYLHMIEGISMKDSGLVEVGVDQVLKGHRTLTRPNGIFAHAPDEFVCFWALGLINYAIELGMKFNVPDSQWLPKALLLGDKGNISF